MSHRLSIIPSSAARIVQHTHLRGTTPRVRGGRRRWRARMRRVSGRCAYSRKWSYEPFARALYVRRMLDAGSRSRARSFAFGPAANTSVVA